MTRSHHSQLIRSLSAVALMLALGSATCSRTPDPVPSWEGLLPVNGTEIFVKRLGRGEPILVVHGGPVMEHGYLLPHLAPLAEHYELIFFDQRLCGRSAADVDSESLRVATFVDDIEALRQSLGLEKIHLLAHSWGGLLALRYALEHQEHLASLVLINSMSPSSDLWQEEERLLAERMTAADRRESAAIGESEAFARQEPDAIRKMILVSFRSQFHDPSLIDQLDLYVPPDYMERSRQFALLMIDLASFDLRDQLGTIHTPTLILYGAAEPSAQLGGTVLRDGIPGAKFALVEKAGHFPFIERPDETLRILREFLGTQED